MPKKERVKIVLILLVAIGAIITICVQMVDSGPSLYEESQIIRMKTVSDDPKFFQEIDHDVDSLIAIIDKEIESKETSHSYKMELFEIRNDLRRYKSSNEINMLIQRVDSLELVD